MSSLTGSKPFQVPTNSDLGRLAYLEVLGWEDTGAAIPTIASATSISPTVKITMISGTATISTITAPMDLVNGGQLVLIPLGSFNLATTGNIALPVVAEISKPITLSYESTTNKWYPHYSITNNKVTITAPATNATLTIVESKSLNVSNNVTFTGDDSLTLTTVAITSITGQFVCGVSNNTLVVGKQIRISGVFGGTGSIVGYTNPTVYYIIVTNGTTTFQLSASLGGAAITTTIGTPTGLTYTCAPVVVIGKGGTIVYNDQTSKVSVLAPSTSAELAGVITDETGFSASAKLMFSISPSISTSLITDSTSFDLINTTATTANIAGAATALSIGHSVTGATTVNFVTGATTTGFTKEINIGTNGLSGSTTTIGINSAAGAGTTTVGGSTLTVSTPSTINLGTSVSALTTATIGGAVSGNVLKLAGTASGTVNLTTDVTTGIVNEWASITTGTINIGVGTGANTINLAGVGGSVNIGTTAGNSTLTINGTATTGIATLQTNTGVTTANVFNTFATTGNLFGAANVAVNIGANGGTAFILNPTVTLTNATTLNLNGASPSIVTSSTIASVFNTSATTGNLFGAANVAVNIGANGGTAFILNPTVTLTNATTLNINGADPSIVTSSTTASVFNTSATTGNLFGAATTLSIGNTATAAQTVNMFTASTGASTYNVATGATTTGLTKAISIGTGGATGSTTTISIGSTIGTTTTVNGTVKFPTVSNLTTGFIKTDATGQLSTDTTSYQTAFTSQTASTFYAAPNGSAGIPAFRTIVGADIPTLNQDTSGTAAKATNLAGGLASQVPYQTGVGTTAFVANGTAGQILTSNGTAAPTWQTPAVSAGKAIALAMVMGF